MKNVTHCILVVLFAALVMPTSVIAKNKAQQPAEKVSEIAQGKKLENILQVIKEQKNISKFVEMLDKTNIKIGLVNDGMNFTIFAPTNEALKKLPSSLAHMNDNPTQLTNFVEYHIINGSQVMYNNIKGRKASPSAMNGAMLNFNGTGQEVLVNNAKFVAHDIKASNGVVHIIDSPLIPPSMMAQPPVPATSPANKSNEESNDNDGNKAEKPVAIPSEDVKPVMPQSPTLPTVQPAKPTKGDIKSWFKGLFGK